MSCSGGKSTKKSSYNKANNLKQPVSYTIDKKGNVVWKFNSQLNAEGHISKAIEELKELN